MNAFSSRKYCVSTLACLAIVLSASIPASAETIFATSAPTLTYTESFSSLYTVGTFMDSDPSFLAGDFQVNIDWMDGTGITAGFIADNGNGFDVTAAHTYAEEGNYNPQLTFLNPSTDTMASALDLAVVMDAALDAGSLSPLSSVEGSTLSGVLGNFQDENTLASFGDFGATINWGDGTVTSGTVSPNGGGQFDIGGTHTYAEQGTYTVTATVQDTGGSTVTMTGSALVSEAPLSGNGNDFGATAGVSFTGLVASFVDGNAIGSLTDFSSMIDWGDGALTAGTVMGSGGMFDVTGTHIFATTGMFTVTTQVQDIGGASTTVFVTADVTDTPATVPEPASWLSAAAGLAIIMFRKKWPGSRSASRSES